MFDGCKPIKEYIDERGKIEEICKNVDVLHISSVAGSKRANHYHKTSSHICLVTKGAIDYYERPVGSNEKPKKTTYLPGDVFYTGPLLEHTMSFSVYTEFTCYSMGDRSQESYENDLVRLPTPLDEV